VNPLTRSLSCVRRFMDNWKFWMLIAYVGLVGLFLFGFALNNRTARAQALAARNDAVRVAERRAAATAAYQRCVGSIVPTQRVSTHVAGVNDLAEILLANAIRNHNVTPRSSPQWETQLVNIRFLRMAVRKVAAVKSFPAPTKAECRARRDEALSQAR
jgi:hypothetical protein